MPFYLIWIFRKDQTAINKNLAWAQSIWGPSIKIRFKVPCGIIFPFKLGVIRLILELCPAMPSMIFLATSESWTQLLYFLMLVVEISRDELSVVTSKTLSTHSSSEKLFPLVVSAKTYWKYPPLQNWIRIILLP